MKGKRGIPGAGIATIVSLACFMTGCGASSEGTEREVTGKAYANFNLANDRNPPSSLRTQTVADLDEGWSHPLEATGEAIHFIGSPAVHDGIAYLQDPDSNVEAIDLDSGETVWETAYNAPAAGTHGVMMADGHVYGATPTKAFALDADTGEEVWSTELLRNSRETIQMTPGYHDGRVYFGTAPAVGEGGEVGVLWALDADSGTKLWHFDNVPRALWGQPDINYGGGIFYAPAFDGEGSLYVGISHAGPIPGTEQFPWGSSRPGPNLYSNSIVKLDEKTGEVQWHYQISPHGICNGYLVSPVIAKVGGRKVVLGAGVSGILVAVDQGSGKLLWRRPVGVHNGHDNDGLLAMRGEYARLKMPMDVYPGTFGGVAAPFSVSGSLAFVPVVNGGTRMWTQTSFEDLGSPTGELVAVDIDSGAIAWKRKFPSPLIGPTTATNELVFANTLDGTLYAFEADKGSEVWKRRLPVNAEGGMAIEGDTLLLRAGDPAEAPELRSYRLPASKPSS